MNYYVKTKTYALVDVSLKITWPYVCVRYTNTSCRVNVINMLNKLRIKIQILKTTSCSKFYFVFYWRRLCISVCSSWTTTLLPHCCRRAENFQQELKLYRNCISWMTRLQFDKKNNNMKKVAIVVLFLECSRLTSKIHVSYLV